jgi:hypothetical protein
MSPVIEHGDQVVVHPFLPPQPGRDCVFLRDAGDGQMLALKCHARRPSARSEAVHVLGRRADSRKSHCATVKRLVKATASS